MPNTFSSLAVLAAAASAFIAAPGAAVTAADSARDAAKQAATAAQVDIPPAEAVGASQPQIGKFQPIQGISITAPEADLIAIMQRHRKRCDAMGPGLCRIETFNAFDRSEMRGGEVQIMIAAHALDGFAAAISADPAISGIQISRGSQHDNSEPLGIRRRILELRGESLRKAQIGVNSAERQVVLREQQQIESELQQIEAQLGDEHADPTRRVGISYRTPDQQGYGRSRWYREFWDKALIISLSAIGLALVSLFYFGILGFGVLWLRRLAIRKGLLKG